MDYASYIVHTEPFIFMKSNSTYKFELQEFGCLVGNNNIRNEGEKLGLLSKGNLEKFQNPTKI